jgi:hypothetical protein
LQLVGERESAGEKLLERSFSPDPFSRTFKKRLFDNAFLKVLGILKPFFQEGFKPPEAVPPLPYKPKFERRLKRYYGIYVVFCGARICSIIHNFPLKNHGFYCILLWNIYVCDHTRVIPLSRSFLP